MDSRKRGEGENQYDDEDAKGQQMNRRSSKKSSIVDRHRRLPSGSHAETSIRVVTPEPAVASANSKRGKEKEDPQPAASPRSRSSRRREHSASVSNTDDEGTIESRRRRNRVKANGEPNSPADASPNSFVSKTRQRLGSLATASSAFSSKPGDFFGSIGYPSITHSPPLPTPKGRQRLSKTSRRSFSANAGLDMPTTVFQSPTFLSTDSTRILQLMKITCGRMHGILFFRPTNVAVWESGYCAINVAPGSLVYQVKGDIALTKTLIPDLRGCSVRTQYDAETQGTYLSVVTASSGLGFQLRPPVPETFDSWLAALLCWQPLRPKGIQNLKTAKAQLSTVEERSRTGHRRISDPTVQQSTAVIKVGTMLLWQAQRPSAPQHDIADREAHSLRYGPPDHLWKRVNCRLQENGHFQLFDASDASHSFSIPLSQLSRNAVQHMDSSVLGADFCIAIYPQYNVHHTSELPSRPVFLVMDSRVPFEVWFVLLRAFTVPELYGPEKATKDETQNPGEEETANARTSMDGLFRVERSLSVRVIEARLKSIIGVQKPHSWRFENPNPDTLSRVEGDFYAEILLDRHIRARTCTKAHTTSTFWAEEFTFNDLPPVLSNACVLVKGGNLSEREWTMVAHGPWDISQYNETQAVTTDIEVMSHDTVHGKLDIQLDSLEQERKAEKWWPLLDNNHRVIGDVLMKLQLQETVVLIHKEYSELSRLLHKFDNSLTTQIAQVLQSDLKLLSDLFLDIFQVSNSVTDWIVSLVDEEIDGIYRETPPTRMRFSNRLHSNDSYESAENRELLVRDLSRTATMEANLLFRGNSLLTKALDAHMRRLGGEYLKATLADTILGIVESDPDCEIDPARVSSPEQMEKNRNNLVALTNNVWQAISTSAAGCPHRLRVLFRHIRSCADDRYGSFIRTVAYTSVSGFLFLRLFCPALLNPKLFGLVDDIPPDRPRRTLTLIAKTLIGLANMTKFGTKESWMEPMNRFLIASTPTFKIFIDQICSVGSDTPSNRADPQYATPTQILERLPETSREGSLSLPYLLDSAKLFARLVNVWTERCPSNFVESGVDETARSFHEICVKLRRRTTECLETAEQAGRPEQDLQPKWERMLAERPAMISTDNAFDDEAQAISPGDVDEVTALPQTRHGKNGYFPLIPTTTRSPVHADEGEDEKGDRPDSAVVARERRLPTDQRPITKSWTSAGTSNNSSTVSLEGSDDPSSRSLPGSRDGSGRNRFKWKGSAARRGKKGEYSQGSLR